MGSFRISTRAVLIAVFAVGALLGAGSVWYLVVLKQYPESFLDGAEELGSSMDVGADLELVAVERFGDSDCSLDFTCEEPRVAFLYKSSGLGAPEVCELILKSFESMDGFELSARNAAPFDGCAVLGSIGGYSVSATAVVEAAGDVTVRLNVG